MRLSDLHPGDEAAVIKILGHGAFRKRVMEMGFVRGHRVKVLLEAPLKDPVKYSVMGYEVSLRMSEASLIEVIKVDPGTDTPGTSEHTAPENSEESLSAGKEVSEIVEAHGKTVNVALLGNPNCGKTSLFNIASGAREHVGNYSGVTVDAKSGTFRWRGYTFRIVDLPGTYSLTAYSPEELYVRSYLRNYTPDVIINVLDSSNLERNMYLSTELIDMNRKMVIALNMYDELRACGARLEYETLGEMIGVPMVPIVSKTGEGIGRLFDTVISVYEDNNCAVRHIHVNLGPDIEGALRQLVDRIKADSGMSNHFSPRYTAIKLLEGDRDIEDHLPGFLPDKTDFQDKAGNILGNWKKHTPCHDRHPLLILRDKLRGKIESLRDEDISSIIAAEKYGFIAGALAETYIPGKSSGGHTTRFLDSVATNRLLGFPLFFLIMFLIFWATFYIGQYPMDWLESGVSLISDAVNKLMSPGPLKDLITDGIIGGVGGVIVFLPNLLILYFCISFMEDSGYMARAAFIMDKVMHRIGLHGKSFIPLVMGFGCNVPAILSSRSIESHSSRIITILINPFMSCSARIPIYVLLIGTFFDKYAALIFMGVYLAGIAVAIITARLLRRFMFRKDETPFVMELPPYRMPTLKASLSHTWEKGRQYLRKMGGIILMASIIVWALNYFPLHDDAGDVQTADITETVSATIEDSDIDPGHDSYLEMVGKAINPVMAPLGFHWRATVAALAGLPAKEIVVSTLGVLYTNDEAVESTRLADRLKAPGADGHPDFTPAAALAFMLFILLYCPCIATVTAIARETGSWKYAGFSMIYNTLIAWLVAFVVYQMAILLC